MDPRKLIEEALTRRAEILLQKMQQTSVSTTPHRIEAEAKMMADLLGTRDFPSGQKSRFRDEASQLQRLAHERAVSVLLDEAEKRAHAGDRAGHDSFVIKAKEHLAKAAKHGAKRDYRKDAGNRLRTIASMGISPAATRPRFKIRSANAIPPSGIENRRTRRYVEPVLTVAIGPLRLSTIDWSISGLLLKLEGQEPALEIGEEVHAEISCPGVEMRHRQSASVTRIDQRKRTLALSFTATDPVMLAFLKALRENELLSAAAR